MSLENNNNDGNKKEKKSLYKVMDKQGFYIILLLCVVVVAATAFWFDNQKEDYFIGEGPTNPFEEDARPEVTLVEDNGLTGENIGESQATGNIGQGKPAENDETPSQIPKDEVKQNIKTNDNKGTKNDVEKNNKAEENNKTEEKEENTETEKLEEAMETSITESMVMPVIGKLGLAFADDHLVYHKTLDQWSTHKGVDILATEGTPVKVVLDGEVVEVVNDSIKGITITVKHNGELLTMYSNLSTDAMVKVGEQVKKGQTISGIGKTASVKSLEGPLLHFQVLKDDKFVNPEIYLGKLNK